MNESCDSGFSAGYAPVCRADSVFCLRHFDEDLQKMACTSRPSKGFRSS
jgi:hypothetical protein